MLPITSSAALKDAILMMENQQEEQLILLKDQLKQTVDSLKPLTLIKNTLHDATRPPEIKDGILNSSLGLAAGYLSQKIMVGSTLNPVKMIFGAVLKYAVTNLVTKNPNALKSVGTGIFNSIFRRNKVHAPYR